MGLSSGLGPQEQPTLWVQLSVLLAGCVPHLCTEPSFAGSAEGEQIPIIVFSLHLEF